MKSEVYSWRVSPELRTGLEREARRRKISVAAALDEAAREWLRRCEAEGDTSEEQIRLHETALKWVGALASGNRNRAENARQSARERLRRRYGR